MNHELLKLQLETLPFITSTNVQTQSATGNSSSASATTTRPQVSIPFLTPFDDPYIPFERMATFLLLEDRSVEASGSGNLGEKNETSSEGSRRAESSSGFQKSDILEESTGRKHGSTLQRSSPGLSEDSNRSSHCHSAVHFTESTEAYMKSDETDPPNSNEQLTNRAKLEELRDIITEITKFNGTQSSPYDDSGDQLLPLAAKLNKVNFERSLQNSLRRNLNEWCAEERIGIDVMIQRLHSALYALPQIEVFERHQDSAHLIVAHHPFDRSLRSNHETWSRWLHVTNLGFRAYLHHVKKHITLWSKEQEIVYQTNRSQAALLQKAGVLNETDPTSYQSTNETGGKSPLIGDHTNQNSNTIQAVDNGAQYIFPGSLKALKKEQEAKARCLEEAAKREPASRARSKLSHSPKHEADSSPINTNRNKAGASSSPKRGASASKNKKTTPLDDTHEKVLEESVQQEVQYRPFTGYNLTNVLPHWTGRTTHLFPTDGGTVKIKRYQQLNDASVVTISVLKDGHVFTVHRTGPPPDPEYEIDEKKCNENCFIEFDGVIDKDDASQPVQNGMKQSKLHVVSSPPVAEPEREHFSSFTGVFTDGLCLALAETTQSPKSQRQVLDASGERSRAAASHDRAHSPAPDDKKNSELAEAGVNEGGQKLSITLPDGTHLDFIQLCISSVLLQNDVQQASSWKTANELEKEMKSMQAQPDDRSVEIQDQEGWKGDSSGSSLMTSVVRMVRATETQPNPKQSVWPVEIETARYINNKGTIIILNKVTSTESEDSVGVKLLFPNGDRAERNTLDWKRQYLNDNPKFKTERPAPICEPIEPTREFVAHKKHNASSERKTGSQARGGKLQKTDDHKRKKDGHPSDSAKSQISEVPIPESKSDPEETQQPWLVTLASGKRYWLRLKKGSSNWPGTRQLSLFTSDDTHLTEKETRNNSSVDRSLCETIPSEQLETFVSYDPATRKTLFTRPCDRFMVVQPEENEMSGNIVQHPDGSRITQILYQQHEKCNKRNEKAETTQILDTEGSCGLLVLRIESPGFPPILLNLSGGGYETFLPGTNGSVSRLYSSVLGEHILWHSGGGRLKMTADGSIIYSPVQKNRHAYLSEAPLTSTYCMRCTEATELLDVVDPEGNMYTVDHFANCNVLLTIKPEDEPSVDSTDSNTIEAISPDEPPSPAGPDGDKQYGAPDVVPQALTPVASPSVDEHLPLLFYYNQNSKECFELMRRSDVADIVGEARQVSTVPPEWSNDLECCEWNSTPSPPAVAGAENNEEAILIEEPHVTNRNILSLTYIKPLSAKRGHAVYAMPNIIPRGLTWRDTHPFKEGIQCRENEKPTRFGENVAKGLDIVYPKLDVRNLSEVGSDNLLMPPRVNEEQVCDRPTRPHLLLRRFTLYPTENENRSRTLSSLHAYAEHLLNRVVEWCQAQPIRSPLSFKKCLTDQLEATSSLDDQMTTELNEDAAGQKQVVDNSAAQTAELVQKSSPCPGSEPDREYLQKPTAPRSSSARKAAYQALQKEIEDAAQNRKALRSKALPSYFETKEGMNFLLRQVCYLIELIASREFSRSHVLRKYLKLASVTRFHCAVVYLKRRRYTLI
ncbi:unnamed protein product [Dicrocoelium dendriticum]|nr:unnamed protein product [Dicrocoelium dendriticum]